MKRVVGVYTGSTEIMQANWKTVEQLKEKTGLNLVILGMGPAGDIWGPSPEVARKAPIEVKPVGKDDRLNEFIQEAHRRDIDVWICIALYAEMDTGPNHPELAFRDFDGNIVEPVSRHGSGWAWSWCPSNRSWRQYNEELLSDLTRRYEVDGFTMTHQRYSPIGHNLFNLFGCGCKECERAAGELGYDFVKMRSGMKKVLGLMKSVDARKLARLRDLDLGFTDLLYYLGADPSLVDWLNFRCDLIGTGMERYHEAVKRVKDDVTMGTDSFPPTFSLIGGHRYSLLERHSDFLSPLLSHIFIFSLFNFMELTARMMDWNSGLSETDLLPVLYRAFGYDKLGLPDSLRAFHEHESLPSSDFSDTKLPLGETVRREAFKAVAAVKHDKPMYGIFSAHSKIDANGAKFRAAAMRDAGMDGIILQVGQLPGPEANLRAISEILSQWG
jgi:hypothetical protein